MIVTPPSSPSNTGPQGIKMAGAAEQLESVLWQQVLSSMTKTAMGGSALGTGSQLYNGIATHALATTMFGRTDSSLTHEIVDQLKAGSSTHNSNSKTSLAAVAAASSVASGQVSTINALTAMPSVTGVPPADRSFINRAISYAESVWPAIKAGAATLDAPPVALLAQSALETGWGSSAPGNNLFGVKAVPGQAGIVEPTHEDSGGLMLPTSAAFADYSTVGAALSHYVNLIRTEFPNAVGSSSVAQYANALAQGGYATDVQYAQKIVDISQSPIMQSVLQAIKGVSP